MYALEDCKSLKGGGGGAIGTRKQFRIIKRAEDLLSLASPDPGDDGDA